MTQPTFKSSRLLLPAHNGYIALSLVVAYIANLLPAGPITFLPDWVAFVLCFWGIREFRKVGMGVAFLMGLLMDVADASLLGQHALAYALLSYTASSLSRRIQWFPLLEQALHVLPLLLGVQIIQFVIRLLAGGEFPGFGYFISPLLAALFWVPGTYLLLLPQFRPVDRDDHRPI